MYPFFRFFLHKRNSLSEPQTLFSYCCSSFFRCCNQCVPINTTDQSYECKWMSLKILQHKYHQITTTNDSTSTSIEKTKHIKKQHPQNIPTTTIIFNKQEHSFTSTLFNLIRRFLNNHVVSCVWTAGISHKTEIRLRKGIYGLCQVFQLIYVCLPYFFFFSVFFWLFQSLYSVMVMSTSYLFINCPRNAGKTVFHSRWKKIHVLEVDLVRQTWYIQLD